MCEFLLAGTWGLDLRALEALCWSSSSATCSKSFTPNVLVARSGGSTYNFSWAIFNFSTTLASRFCLLTGIAGGWTTSWSGGHSLKLSRKSCWLMAAAVGIIGSWDIRRCSASLASGATKEELGDAFDVFGVNLLKLLKSIFLLCNVCVRFKGNLDISSTCFVGMLFFLCILPMLFKVVALRRLWLRFSRANLCFDDLTCSK